MGKYELFIDGLKMRGAGIDFDRQLTIIRQRAEACRTSHLRLAFAAAGTSFVLLLAVLISLNQQGLFRRDVDYLSSYVFGGARTDDSALISYVFSE